MIRVVDGPLYQWESGRKIEIELPEGITINEVHFAKEDEDIALVTKPYEEDGTLLANIPNIHLQTHTKIRVYLFCRDGENGRTIPDDGILTVIPRAKPDDYVYTETETLCYQALEERLKILEEGGTDGGMNKEQFQEAVNTALAQAKESGEFDGADGTTPHIGENGNWFIGESDTGVSASGGTTSITVDDKLNKESTNPIQNKTVAEAVDRLSETINTLTLGKHTDGLVYIFIGGQPIGNGLDISGGSVVEPVYGEPVTDNAILALRQNQSVALGVKLSEEPTQAQTITILSDSDILSFDKETLEFTVENWNVFQYVTVTAGTFSESQTVNITLRNSDKLLTDTSIPVALKYDSYSVDTTIPTEGQHVVTVDDFTSNSTCGNYIRLYGYKAEYNNIVIPSTLDGKIPWLVCAHTGTPSVSNTSFVGNTTIKYVTFEDGVVYRGAGVTSGCDATSLFENCTNLIGVSNINVETKSLSGSFKSCTSLKFVDNLDKLVNLTDLYQSFYGCTGLEQIQDLSDLVLVTEMTGCFRGCTSLVSIGGFPVNATKLNTVYNNATALKNVPAIPSTATTMLNAFSNCDLEKIVLYPENLTTSVITASDFSSMTDVTIYCVKGSATETMLKSAFATSTNVTIANVGDGDEVAFITCWGDSITANGGICDGTWAHRLADNLTSHAVKNLALSGEYTVSTSARQGGNELYVSAFTIPATTDSVKVNLKSEDGQVFSNDPVLSTGAGFNPVTISGIEGYITKSGSDYYFARSEAGEETSVSENTVVYSPTAEKMNNADVMIIYIGTNSGWNTNATTLKNQIDMMVEYFGKDNYLILSPASGKHLDSNLSVVQEFESIMTTAYGDKFLNLREYLITNGLSDNGLSATATDTERMNAGLVAQSILYSESDTTHFNSYGQNSIYIGVKARLLSLGYITE